MAYKLELSSTAAIHPVFHVLQLKKVLGEHSEVQQDIPYMPKNHEWKAISGEVYGYLKNKVGRWDVLVSWKGLPRHEATWEAYDEIQQLFPEFHLKYKVNLEREFNDRPSIILQYSRRRKKGSTL